MLPVFSLDYTARDTAFCLVLISLGLAELGEPFLRSDPSHLILHCPATDSLRRLLFGDSISLRPLELPGLWGSMVFRHANALVVGAM